MDVIQTKSVVTTTKRSITLDRKAIRALMAMAHNDIPETADIYVQIPGGGDWSNTALDIDAENPVTIEWTEVDYSA